MLLYQYKMAGETFRWRNRSTKDIREIAPVVYSLLEPELRRLLLPILSCEVELVMCIPRRV